MKFKSIIFDLDDTLIDTFNHAIQPALDFTFEKLQEINSILTKENFIQERVNFTTHPHSKNFFTVLGEKFGTSDSEKKLIEETGKRAFYQDYTHEKIVLFPEAYDVLETLKENFQLFLVTAGSPEKQSHKLELTKLSSFFEKTYYVDVFQNKKKIDTFKILMEENQLHPKEILCVGDRLSKEIHDANVLGIPTCHIKKGEYSSYTPSNSNEIPQFTIDRLTEIIELCKN